MGKHKRSETGVAGMIDSRLDDVKAIGVIMFVALNIAMMLATVVGLIMTDERRKLLRDSLIVVALLIACVIGIMVAIQYADEMIQIYKRGGQAVFSC
jgi:uncharacterized membrane protein